MMSAPGAALEGWPGQAALQASCPASGVTVTCKTAAEGQLGSGNHAPHFAIVYGAEISSLTFALRAAVLSSSRLNKTALPKPFCANDAQEWAGTQLLQAGLQALASPAAAPHQAEVLQLLRLILVQQLASAPGPRQVPPTCPHTALRLCSDGWRV